MTLLERLSYSHISCSGAGFLLCFRLCVAYFLYLGVALLFIRLDTCHSARWSVRMVYTILRIPFLLITLACWLPFLAVPSG
jgi:hypothetical protein